MKKCILYFSFILFIRIGSLNAQISTTDVPGYAVSSPSSACLSCAGSIWNNETNVYLADGNPADIDLMQNAFCFQSTCYYSRYLVCSQFGFSIPVTATIVGIETTILRKAPSTNTIKDSIVLLAKNGSVNSSDYKSPVLWPTTYANHVYGGPANLWGLTWTPADINNPATSLSMMVYNKSASAQSGISVDQVSMTVYYTTATGILESQTASPNMFSVHQNNEHAILCSFTCSQKSSAMIHVYDANGKLIANKDLGVMNSGVQQELIFTEELKTGIYFVQFVCGDMIVSRKVFIK